MRFRRWIDQIIQGNGQITMPVVYIIHDYWLHGLSHVLAEHDTATSTALKEASNGRNVYHGYIGLYFPCASAIADNSIWLRFPGNRRIMKLSIKLNQPY